MFRATKPRGWRRVAEVGTLVVAFSVALAALAAEPAHFLGVTPTQQWVDFYGTLLIGDIEAELGDEVGVFDQDGVLCGAFALSTTGMYGFLHVYRDDNATPSVDEGARPGDVLVFKVWDSSEQTETTCDTLGPDPPVWTANGDHWNVDLRCAGPAPPSAGLSMCLPCGLVFVATFYACYSRRPWRGLRGGHSPHPRRL